MRFNLLDHIYWSSYGLSHIDRHSRGQPMEMSQLNFGFQNQRGEGPSPA
jgi:hypothetical protein